MPRAFPTAVIENLQPLVDGGRYPVKRVVGRGPGRRGRCFQGWARRCRGGAEMATLGETRGTKRRWRMSTTTGGGASAPSTKTRPTNTPSKPGPTFRGWQHEFAAKFEAGHREPDERNAGRRGLARGGRRRERRQTRRCGRLRELARSMREREHAEINAIAHSGELEVLMATYPGPRRRDAVRPGAARRRRSERGAHRRLV